MIQNYLIIIDDHYKMIIYESISIFVYCSQSIETCHRTLLNGAYIYLLLFTIIHC
jgi:hypothetical protein